MRTLFSSITMLALLGSTTSTPLSASRSNSGIAPRSVTPALPTRLASISAAEFRRFVRDSVQWEERTKTWQNHETAERSAPASHITRLWAVAEVGVVRLQMSDLRDRRPRVVSMLANDGQFAMHGMAPGDTMYLVLEMEERSDAIDAYAVVASPKPGRVVVHALGRPRVCNRWQPAAAEVSYFNFVSGRSCDTGVDEHHDATGVDRPTTSQKMEVGAEADSDGLGPVLTATGRAFADVGPAPANRTNLGLRGADQNCTGLFTCADGSCAIGFPDGSRTPREMK